MTNNQERLVAFLVGAAVATVGLLALAGWACALGLTPEPFL